MLFVHLFVAVVVLTFVIRFYSMETQVTTQFLCILLQLLSFHNYIVNVFLQVLGS